VACCREPGEGDWRPPAGDAGSGRGLEARAQAEGMEFVVPLAPTLNAAQRETVVKLVERFGRGLDVRLVKDARERSTRAASVVASGRRRWKRR